MSKQVPGVYRTRWISPNNIMDKPFCVVERCNKDISRSCPIWLPVVSLEPLNNYDNLGEYDIEFVATFVAQGLTEVDKNFTPRGKSNDVRRLAV